MSLEAKKTQLCFDINNELMVEVTKLSTILVDDTSQTKIGYILAKLRQVSSQLEFLKDENREVK